MISNDGGQIMLALFAGSLQRFEFSFESIFSIADTKNVGPDKAN